MTDGIENLEDEDVIADEDTAEGGEDTTEGGEDTTEGGEDTAEGGEDTTEGGAPAAAAPSRAQARITALSDRARAAEERAIRAETLAEERAPRPAPVNNEEARRQRDEKLALMDPAERKSFLQDEQLQSMQQTILLTQLQTQDALDKNSYSLTARGNPVFAKHAAEVEKRLSAERQAGRNWSRETILAQILGESALKAKPDKKQKEEAKERVTTASGARPAGRGNSSTYRPARGNESLEQLEQRLENVTF